MMGKNKQIILAGYGLAVISGIGLFFHLKILFLSVVEPDSALVSIFKSGNPDFRIRCVLLAAVFFSQMIASLGVAKLQEWARRTLVAINLSICCFFLFRMIMIQETPDFFVVLTVLLYILIILFFIQPKIKAEFRFNSNTSVESKKKIMIVDDDKGLLKMIRAHLLYNGFEVITATTGEKGLQLARRRKPDLIILDVILPGRIKGRDVCSQLKDDSQTLAIPVLFLTAKDSPDDVKAEMEAGAIEHLTKPVNLKGLLSEIKKILGI